MRECVSVCVFDALVCMHDNIGDLKLNSMKTFKFIPGNDNNKNYHPAFRLNTSPYLLIIMIFAKRWASEYRIIELLLKDVPVNIELLDYLL